jgi:hypothetical protein
LSVAFPEGGVEPFVASSFVPAIVLVLAVLAVLPAAERELRVAVALYAAATVASYALDTPMGGNVTRLGTLFAGPVLACAVLARRDQWRRVALALLVLPLLQWQWGPPVRDWRRAHDDPSVHASYYRGLVGFLDAAGRGDDPFRIEIPFTANHWEARHVAPHTAIARGWERQLDLRDNPVFYGPPLTAATYHAWLRASAVRYVALPDVPLDYSARDEARIVRAQPPFLRPVWHDRHWRVFAVAGTTPLADGARITTLGPDSFGLEAAGPATALVRIRFTPYWHLTGAQGCVSRAPGGWTRVRLARGGKARVSARFALGRVLAHGPRCSPG